MIHINIDTTRYKGILLNQDIRFQNFLCKYEIYGIQVVHTTTVGISNTVQETKHPHRVSGKIELFPKYQTHGLWWNILLSLHLHIANI